MIDVKKTVKTVDKRNYPLTLATVLRMADHQPSAKETSSIALSTMALDFLSMQFVVGRRKSSQRSLQHYSQVSKNYGSHL
jgi:hypothetical protein